MKFNLALVQFQTKQWKPEENISRMEKFIIDAKKKKADVIIFPEDCVAGAMLDNTKMVDKKGTYRKLFSKLAAKYEIDLIPGSWMEEDEDLGGHYNTSCYIDSKGDVLATYRKINLWISERSYLTPGNQIQVFNTRFGKAGLIICWDLSSPDIFRRMLSQGAEIVYCPADWSCELVSNSYNENAEKLHVNALCQARAIENNIILAYCNLAGEHIEKGMKDPLIGQTQIASPFNAISARINDNKEEMIVKTVDMKILKEAEKLYHRRADYLEKNI